MNRNRTLAGLILAILVLTLLPTAAAAQAPRAQIDPHIWEVIREKGDAEVLVILKVQADLEGARSLRTKEEKGWYVYRELTALAERTQEPLRYFLDSLGAYYRSYWIRNMLLVRADTALVNTLAGRAEVARIDYLYPATLEPVSASAEEPHRGEGIELSLIHI